MCAEQDRLFIHESLNSHCSHAVTTYTHIQQQPIEFLIPSTHLDRPMVVVSKISYHSIECMKNLKFHTPETTTTTTKFETHYSSVFFPILL